MQANHSIMQPGNYGAASAVFDSLIREWYMRQVQVHPLIPKKLQSDWLNQ